ncbi:SUN domain-containing protein 1-like isoform X2 [Dunckerocampus dactyliophorus]|uniref:SUN domain-containing protein 1-like isoform X2 n=1 Tax=Dunckerocampus dactyliophorus TaxID=161453 RepID=UPI0024055A7B|nr:SUN domain-containing protein 1-like isoform X2 [Dunckerocampus dactyliophorus]
MIICDEDVDLQSWGWTDLSSYWSAVSDSDSETGIMSRRSLCSLRLDDGLLDRSLPLGSTSFSLGGSSWRNTRTLKSLRSQQLSVSCSESVLVHTPRKPSGHSFHSVTSDASLITSMLDESSLLESSIQETTVVDSFWGLDQDLDPKESTITAEQSSVLANSTLIASDCRCPKHPVQTLTRVSCKDCESDRRESGTTNCSSSKHTTAPALESSTIYCRDRRRQVQTAGVLSSIWNAGAHASRRYLSCVFAMLVVFYQQLHKHHHVSDVLQLWWDWSLFGVRRVVSCYHFVLMHMWQLCRGLSSKTTGASSQNENRHGGPGSRLGHGGTMSTKQAEHHANGSLCDDCKKRQRAETHDVGSSSSARASALICLLVLTWNMAVFTVWCLCRLTSLAWTLTRTIWSSICLRRSAGSTLGGVFRWNSRRWSDCPLLTWFPIGLFVVLLLFCLCCFGPTGLPALSVLEWRTSVSYVPVLSSVYSLVSSESQAAAAEGAVEDSKEEAAASQSARLNRLERSVASLWERVEMGGRRAEQRHGELLEMYSDIQQRDSAHNGQLWLSSLVDQQLFQLRRRQDEDRRQREQDLVQQQSQTSRLDHLEVKLQNLGAKTEEVRLRQETMTAPSMLPAVVVGVAVDSQSHDALLAEVGRLETALEEIRRDLEVLSGCQDGCQRLDLVQQTISAQVHEEVRILLYGKELTDVGEASTTYTARPDSLLRWLSQRYVSGADLQASLASLERSILQNISLHLDRRRSEAEVREAAVHAAGMPVTREVRKVAADGTLMFFFTAWFVWLQEVNVIVKNALRLFSHDRTGLADYALESGGGSILSTRCSETYKTRAALLSLFGLPLWYFSQSPRVVIQPDVQPGNCWAFKGSAGFLVIRLSMRILPTAFSLEHIPKALAPSRTLRSAPRDFSVYGLDDESQERGTLLGSYTYEEDGDALQTYSVAEENNKAFQVIEVQVLSNWGHEEYTCMYRFRVHGSPCDA